VADNGPGVPDDRKESVFGKSQQGRGSPGTGIGLFLVHTPVEWYGDEVWVEEYQPRGTIFSVELHRPPEPSGRFD